MKRLATLALAAILTCGICESAFAQTNRATSSQRKVGTLTERQKEDLKVAARKKVIHMAELIRKIANKERYTNRERFIKDARWEFIKYCQPYFYEVKDENGNVLEKKKNDGVIMEIATATKESFSVYERLMRVYFYNLMKLNYKTVKITNTDFVNTKATNPEKIGEDEDGNEIYKCMVIYVQRFVAQTHEGKIINDDTTKVVEVYIKRMEILNNINEPEIVFSIKLGDILVDKLEKTDPSKNIELIPDEELFLY